MTNWLYRATEAGTDDATTAELLDLGFLCADVCKRGGDSMPRVRDVGIGDAIHVVYRRNDGSVESLGSFRVTSTALPGTSALSSATKIASVQRSVVPGSDLERALRDAKYERDPHLDLFTGWVVEPIEPLVTEVPRGILANRGRNALFQFDPVTCTILTKDARKAGSKTNAGPQPARGPTAPGLGGSSKTAVVEVSSSAPSEWRAAAGLRAVGLDWSGSKEAGKKIWQAHLDVDASSRIVLKRLDRPFLANPEPSKVRAGFARWFAGLNAQVVGMDFCFGLEKSHARLICAAASVQPATTLEPVQLGSLIVRLYPSAEDLRTACGPERKRKTDVAAGSPFAPTNLRMFRQTWLGLSCLATLSNASIAPWASAGDTVIVEVLPALVARSLGSDGGYKGRSTEARNGRQVLTTTIERLVSLAPPDRQTLVDDVEGDAIDAVLAGLAALRAHREGFAPPPSAVLDEGWIY